MSPTVRTGRDVFPLIRATLLYRRKNADGQVVNADAPFGRSDFWRLVADGKLTGRKIDGKLFITRGSLDELAASAVPWKPGGKR